MGKAKLPQVQILPPSLPSCVTLNKLGDIFTIPFFFFICKMQEAGQTELGINIIIKREEICYMQGSICLGDLTS